MKILHSIDTGPNPKGLCALSPNSDNSYLAFPGTNQAGKTGDVILFDAQRLHHVNEIHAHQGDLSAIAINGEGTLLATASEKGTVIRVFSIPEASNKFTFRRGSYAATVYSLAFNHDSKWLCASSDTGTVHIFDLQGAAVGGGGLMSYYLPTMLNDMIEPSRSVAFAKLPSAGIASLCGFSQNNNVMVVTAEGILYIYRPFEHSAADGGELKMLREHKLLEVSNHEVGSRLLMQ